MNFVVVSDKRGGTNFLIRSLAHHPKIEQVWEEPFCHPEIYGLPKDWPRGRAVSYVLNHATGFAIHRQQELQKNWANVWVANFAPLAESGELRVIDVKRIGILGRYVSQCIAERTGKWVDIHEPYRYKGSITVDIADFERYIDATFRAWAHKDMIFRNAMYRHEVTYEELDMDFSGKLGEILSFLSLPRVDIKPATHKREIRQLSEFVTNYQEIKDALKRYDNYIK